MRRFGLQAWILFVWLGACVTEAGDAQLGQLALSLSTEAAGVSYRLSDARFALNGPVQRELVAGDEPTLELELPAGAYSVRLLDGYRLTRSEDASATQVDARLVSANPMPVLIGPGETARVTLRFELAAQSQPAGSGRLAVDLAVGPADAGSACQDALRISELDYEQVGADETEFVEILNTASCEVALASVLLELVNGEDGKVYSRYDLSKAGPTLAAGARLVVGDPAVLSLLPSGVLALPLNGAGLQNGPDGLRLARGEHVLDSVAYEGAVSGLGDTFSAGDEAELALSRCPEALDTNDAALDFKLGAPTPGQLNACG